jgi:DNA primase
VSNDEAECVELLSVTSIVNGGTVPRGADFVRAVRELAERAGVDPSPLERSQPRDRRADLLRDFFGFCRFELVGEGGAEARAYLERRGFPDEAIADSGLGVVPAPAKTRSLLERAGYRPEEIAKAGVLADSRWPGRLCGAWRDGWGRIGTFWARSLESEAAAGSRYLYLRGASRTDLPPYGLSDLLDRPPDSRREIVLVEGFFDVHQLRACAIPNIAALGGTSVRPQTFELLHRLGIEAVTLCLDNDEAGRGATARAVENAARARQSPDVYVIDPERLARANDPDELVRQRGVAAWRDLVKAGGAASPGGLTNSPPSPPIRQSPNVAPRSRGPAVARQAAAPTRTRTGRRDPRARRAVRILRRGCDPLAQGALLARHRTRTPAHSISRRRTGTRTLNRRIDTQAR